MIRYLFNKMLVKMNKQYDYDVRYLQDVLTTDLSAFTKFLGVQAMSSHSKDVPIEPLFAARIRAIIYDDCGPCIQLVVNMALEAKISPAMIKKIINNEHADLPDDVALVMQFTERVLAHDPSANDLRKQITALWGQQGLITLGFNISSSRVYPTLKYTLGYGHACHQIKVEDLSLVPARGL